jgi:CDP-diacylglycerol--serine O-phosphatidyltransferase
MQLSNALFVLPTLFTLTSVFLGVLSLVNSAEGSFGAAALAIVFAFVFDSLDGRVARLTRTQSKFGTQIDSLSDVISFGVAPGVLVYMSLLRDQLMVGSLDVGLVLCFLYVAAGAIRLARYNVEAERKPGPVKMFTGMPIPGAAGFAAGLVLGLEREGCTVAPLVAGLIMLGLALLMVSTIKYRKSVGVREASTRVLLGMLLATMVVVGVVRPPYVAFSFFAFYVVSGFIDGGIKRMFPVRVPPPDAADGNRPGESKDV